MHLFDFVVEEPAKLRVAFFHAQEEGVVLGHHAQRNPLLAGKSDASQRHLLRLRVYGRAGIRKNLRRHLEAMVVFLSRRFVRLRWFFERM